MKNGGTAEDCVVALSAENNSLVNRVMNLQGIVPRKVRLSNGKVMIWRCPDEMIPEDDMSKVNISGSHWEMKEEDR